MTDFSGFSEASILYADNYYLIARLEQVFKKDQTALFQSIRHMIEKKEWVISGEWKINISGTYFELKYQTENGKEPFMIVLRLGPRDLANKNKENDREGEKRSFEIFLAARPDINDLKSFRTYFFQLADTDLKKDFETDINYYPTRSTGQSLVKKQMEYNLSTLINAMEEAIEGFMKLAEYAKQSFEGLKGDRPL